MDNRDQREILMLFGCSLFRFDQLFEFSPSSALNQGEELDLRSHRIRTRQGRYTPDTNFQKD